MGLDENSRSLKKPKLISLWLMKHVGFSKKWLCWCVYRLPRTILCFSFRCHCRVHWDLRLNLHMLSNAYSWAENRRTLPHRNKLAVYRSCAQTNQNVLGTNIRIQDQTVKQFLFVFLNEFWLTAAKHCPMWLTHQIIIRSSFSVFSKKPSLLKMNCPKLLDGKPGSGLGFLPSSLNIGNFDQVTWPFFNSEGFSTSSELAVRLTTNAFVFRRTSTAWDNRFHMHGAFLRHMDSLTSKANNTHKHRKNCLSRTWLLSHSCQQRYTRACHDTHHAPGT